MKKIQQGFTLIELMIVVAIIGILAAVAIPAYQDYIIKAKLSKIQSSIDPIKMALAMYYQEQGGFVLTATNAAATSHTVVHADAGQPSDAYFTSLGLSTYPSLPNEVKDMTLATTAANVIKITLTPQNIKAGPCGAIATPSSASAIDGCPLVMTGTAAATAIDWSYTDAASTIMGNLAASKFFK